MSKRIAAALVAGIFCTTAASVPLSLPSADDELAACFGNYCLPKDYNKLVPPSHVVEVGFRIWALHVRGVNDHEFSIKLDIRLETQWPDRRIIHLNEEENKATFLPDSFASSIWIPEFYIHKIKDGTIDHFSADLSCEYLYILSCTRQMTAKSAIHIRRTVLSRAFLCIL